MRLFHKIRCRALGLIDCPWPRQSQLLLIGDSLSTGCFPWLLGRRIRERGLSVGIRVIAKSGATTEDAYDIVLKRLERDSDVRADRALQRTVGVGVLLGGNDLKREFDFRRPRFERVLHALLDLIEGYFPKAFRCVATYPVPGPHPRLPASGAGMVRSKLNPAIRKIVEETDSYLCNLEDIFAINNELRYDGVHPTIPGEKRMTDAWFETIFPLLVATLETDSGRSVPTRLR